MSNQVAIVIPVYKPDPAWNEVISLRQTFKVLNRYPIVLVCPEGLDISAYETLAAERQVTLKVEHFHPKFFDGIKGYNRLMLSAGFYGRFAQYEYILICQPDAYVFRDELLMWCKRGYDYVGAPVIYGDIEHCWVGNGGLSLRKIEAFTNYFGSTKRLYNIDKIAEHIKLKEKFCTRWFVWILYALGWHNRPNSAARAWMYNEDLYWCNTLNDTPYALTKPSSMEALCFSFEQMPSYCYQLSNHSLPMGCHAWEKYEYEIFWKKFIS